MPGRLNGSPHPLTTVFANALISAALASAFRIWERHDGIFVSVNFVNICLQLGLTIKESNKSETVIMIDDEQVDIDADRVAKLVKAHRELTDELERLLDAGQITTTEVKLKHLRNEIVEAIYPYLRKLLQPILRKKYPNLIASTDENRGGLNRSFQFTDLYNDFFHKVLERPESKFWKTDAEIDLRKFTCRAMENAIRDGLRRLKKRDEMDDDAVQMTIEMAAAREAEERLRQSDLDLRSVMKIVDGWEQASDLDHRIFARLIKLHFLLEMSETEVESDVNVADIPKSTAYRKLNKAMDLLRCELQSEEQG